MRAMQYPFDTTMFDFKPDPLDVNDKLWVLKVYEDQCEVMQFTGLLDKNGKEIYEGDIVQWWIEGTQRFADELLRVEWHKSGFVLFSKLFNRFATKNGGYCSTEQARDYLRHSEVIGNIYENPDLITPSQCPLQITFQKN